MYLKMKKKIKYILPCTCIYFKIVNYALIKKLKLINRQRNELVQFLSVEL